MISWENQRMITSSWQNPLRDLDDRKIILKEMVALIKPLTSYYLPDPKETSHARRLNSIAKIIQEYEIRFYMKSASSLEEYNDLRSFQRRFQFLITSIYRDTEEAMKKMEIGQLEKPLLIKNLKVSHRSRSHHHELVSKVSAPMIKRRRLSSPLHSQLGLLTLPTVMLSLICEFLPGQEVIRCRQLCKGAVAQFFPLVKTLQLSPAGLSSALDAAFQTKVVNLTSLIIYNDAIDERLIPLDGSPVHAETSNDAEVIVVRLSQVIVDAQAAGLPVFPRLKKWSMRRVFYNTTNGNGITSIARALTCMPHLNELNLCQNLLGNRGVEALAKVLYMHAEMTLCPRLRPSLGLTRLNLSRNFVGEDGCSYIANTLQHCLPSLTFVSLDGNCLSERCLALLESDTRLFPQAKKMSFSYDDNYTN